MTVVIEKYLSGLWPSRNRQPTTLEYSQWPRMEHLGLSH